MVIAAHHELRYHGNVGTSALNVFAVALKQLCATEGISSGSRP